MDQDLIVFSLFVIFLGSTVFATIALFTRQSLLVAYILLGMILGPYGIGILSEIKSIDQISHVGIIFLLFLLGLNLHPQNLLRLLKNTFFVTIISAVIFAAIGYLVAIGFGYSVNDAMIIAVCMMFSSTILGLKLLPTTVLHHQRMGEVIISVLLLQDLLAIIVLLYLHAQAYNSNNLYEIILVIIYLPAFLLLSFLVQKYLLVKLLLKFDKIQEYIFLLAVAWCLTMAQVAELLHLSYEIGAFVAGVALASSPISLFIAESLKPLRDFFLILFFFSLGAGFNINNLPAVLLPSIMLAGFMLIVKPCVFKLLLRRFNIAEKYSWEMGVRLGQISEFSLMIVYIAMGSKMVSANASYLVQAATILTFIVSSYVIVLKFPTPVAIKDELRRD